MAIQELIDTGPDQVAVEAGVEQPASHGPDVSVSIVSYNTRDLLRDCLNALLAREHEGEAVLEIIVADNGSTDGSIEMVRDEFAQVPLVETGGNIGYGRGNNRGLAAAHGRYYFILNSDTEVEPGAIREMLAWMDEHPDVGMVGAQLVLPDGSTQASCATDPTLMAMFLEQTYLYKILPKSRLFGGYTMTHWDYNEIREVEQVCGACFFVRAEAFKQLNGFDEAYFMYFEDTDFCVRMRRAGWPIYFLPQARIQHRLGASSGRDWRLRALMIASYNESRYYFFTRNGGWLCGQVLRFIVLMGAALRLGVWSIMYVIRPSSRDQAKIFLEVFVRTWKMSSDPRTLLHRKALGI